MADKTLDANKNNPGKLKRAAGLITGFGLVAVLWRSIAGSTLSMLRPDQSANSLADASDEQRLLFATRLRTEGFLFFGLAIIGAVGGLVGAAGQGVLYMIAGTVALLTGSVIGIIKMWQADMVSTGKPVSFFGWVGLAGKE